MRTLQILLFLGVLCIFNTTTAQNIPGGFSRSDLNPKATQDSLLHELKTSYSKRNYGNVVELAATFLKMAHSNDKYSSDEYKARAILGKTFLKLRDTAQAESTFLEMEKHAKQHKSDPQIMGAQLALAELHMDTNPNKAIAYNHKARLLSWKEKKPEDIFPPNFNLAELYLNRGDYTSAESHIQEAFYAGEKLDGSIYSSSLYMIKGRSLLLQDNIDDALLYFEKALPLAKQGHGKVALLDTYKYYIEALSIKKNYQKIYELRLEYDSIKDMEFEKAKNTELAATISKFNLAQYKEKLKASENESEREKQKAERNKNLVYLISGLTGFMLIALIGLIFSYRRRKSLLVNLEEQNHKYLLAKERSERLTKTKSKFFSTISHELRTPLYGIIGISSSLLENNKVLEHKEDIESLKFSADYLMALINDVLHINKLDATQEFSLEKVHINIRSLVNDISKSFEFMRVQNNNDFETVYHGNIPEFILGDRVKLAQILMNLLGNACKFTENGSVTLHIETVSVEGNEATLKFTIKDTGIGIPQEKQQKIFEEFTQIASDSQYQGTGLGLPIVQKLLDMHDSKLQLYSRLGEGSEFSFELSYPIISEVVQKTQNASILNLDNLKDKKILVVDDNRINQIVTQKMLEKLQIKFESAWNGQEAVEMCKKNIYDLVLMDINMPILNGIDATKNIRQFNQELPIIALTAVEIADLDIDILETGMTDVIVKPYDPTRFKKTLSMHILGTPQKVNSA